MCKQTHSRRLLHRPSMGCPDRLLVTPFLDREVYILAPGRSRSFGIISHARAAPARDRAAQMNITIRYPNTNASPIDCLTALLAAGLRPLGGWRPASPISS